MLPILLDPAKFKDALLTAKGEQRAHVGLKRSRRCGSTPARSATSPATTATSNPRRATIAWPISRRRSPRLPRRDRARLPATRLIGFTGGEPFMNPDLSAMLEDVLSRGLHGHGADQRHEADAQDEAGAARPAAALRPRPHVARLARPLRSPRCMRPIAACEAGSRPSTGWSGSPNGLRRRSSPGAVFGRDRSEVRRARAAVRRARRGDRRPRSGDAGAVSRRWTPRVDVPEITEACWGILKNRPTSVMCASPHGREAQGRRAPGRRRLHPAALRSAFELGETLADSVGAVRLNHPHCAKFCVLGGAACSQ